MPEQNQNLQLQPQWFHKLGDFILGSLALAGFVLASFLQFPLSQPLVFIAWIVGVCFFWNRRRYIAYGMFMTAIFIILAMLFYVLVKQPFETRMNF